MFGGLGWGFGGSIAYMYPISFTESGHTATTYYGFFSLFLEGGLWCGMGAAGTALAATMPLSRMTAILHTVVFRSGGHGVEALDRRTAGGFAGARRRRRGGQHLAPARKPALLVRRRLAAGLHGAGGCLCIRPLRSRATAARSPLDHPAMLLPFAAGGAVLGYVVQALLQAAGLEESIRRTLVVKLGDLNYVNPADGEQVRSGPVAHQLAAVF